MKEEAPVPLTRRGVLLGILALLAGCAAELDAPATSRRPTDPDDFDTQNPDMGGGM